MSYSPGVEVGDWIFVAGQIASEYSERGMHPDHTRDPRQPVPSAQRGAAPGPVQPSEPRKGLTTGRSSFKRTVRVDQFMVLEDTPDGERNEISEYIRTRNELIPSPTDDRRPQWSVAATSCASRAS